MSASDPSGAEMRSPNELRRLTPDDLAKVEAWYEETPFLGAPGHVRLLIAEVRACWSEVSPRSSGGAPPSELALDKGDLARLQASLEREGALGAVNSWALISEMRRALAQVSALRQEAAQAVANARVRRKYIDEAAAARQEAETLTRQRDAAIREISVIAREAETLRGQLDAAQRPHVVTDARLAEQMDEALGEALMELAQAQRALVLLADQLERHSVPFVPAAEAATALARHETANDERLMAVGLRAAQRVYEKARAARAASPVLEPSPSETTNG
jgi:hypothetical protein